MDVGFEGGELAVEVGRVLTGQYGIAGEESVFEGVLRDAGFAYFGAWSRGFFCVVTISFNLRIRSHDYYSFRGTSWAVEPPNCWAGLWAAGLQFQSRVGWWGSRGSGGTSGVTG